ncbi:MAG TPA: DapH/DapD/GlmU-related protein [Casimicrobiaceae bacterium]|nr:DapH/DapD/GlmU-related protein [Casimicrobiaceae bacterium]
MKRLLWLLGPLPFLALAILTMGLAAGAGAAVFHALHPFVDGVSSWLRYPLTGVLLALGYFAYGLAILVIAPAINFVLGGRLSPYRGSAVTLAALRWYVHCTMTLVVRYSFLEFVTPSPFSQMYYRLMGMRIGREVTLNSTAIADPSLIAIGDRATIGGSANILAHYAQGGYLVIAPVKIGAGATIGMRAIVMGGVEVGEKAKVLANSFVLPNTKIPAGESWAGIPAQRIELPKRPHDES